MVSSFLLRRMANDLFRQGSSSTLEPSSAIFTSAGRSAQVQVQPSKVGSLHFTNDPRQRKSPSSSSSLTFQCSGAMLLAQLLPHLPTQCSTSSQDVKVGTRCAQHRVRRYVAAVAAAGCRTETLILCFVTSCQLPTLRGPQPQHVWSFVVHLAPSLLAADGARVPLPLFASITAP